MLWNFKLKKVDVVLRWIYDIYNLFLIIFCKMFGYICHVYFFFCNNLWYIDTFYNVKILMSLWFMPLEIQTVIFHRSKRRRPRWRCLPACSRSLEFKDGSGHDLHHLQTSSHIWVFPKIGVPQNGWSLQWKSLLKWMIWGLPLFSETSISKEIKQILIIMYDLSNH